MRDESIHFQGCRVGGNGDVRVVERKRVRVEGGKEGERKAEGRE